MHENPADFAAKIKKAALLMLHKWESDRAALEAQAARADDMAQANAVAQASARQQHLAELERLQEQMRGVEAELEGFKLEAEGERNKRYT